MYSGLFLHWKAEEFPNPGDSLLYLCAATHSLSALSMRDCQPRPVERKCSITSLLYRTVTGSFRGVFCGPRCPGLRESSSAASLGPKISGSTSAAGLKSRMSSRVNSLTSPCLSVKGFLFKVSHLSFVCFAKTDNSNAAIYRHETDDVQALFKKSKRNNSGFAVITPAVFVKTAVSYSNFSASSNGKQRLLAFFLLFTESNSIFIILL